MKYAAAIQEVKREFPGSEVTVDYCPEAVIFEVHGVPQERKHFARCFSIDLRKGGFWTEEHDLVIIPMTEEESRQYQPGVLPEKK